MGAIFSACANVSECNYMHFHCVMNAGIRLYVVLIGFAEVVYVVDRLVYFDIHSNPVNERLKQTFELHIHFVDEKKDFIMKFAGTKTIRQVCS
jgi:hypothetical protein